MFTTWNDSWWNTNTHAHAHVHTFESERQKADFFFSYLIWNPFKTMTVPKRGSTEKHVVSNREACWHTQQRNSDRNRLTYTFKATTHFRSHAVCICATLLLCHCCCCIYQNVHEDERNSETEAKRDECIRYNAIFGLFKIGQYSGSSKEIQ